METSLHRQLKEEFRLPESEIEVKVGRYRIDVVNDGRLVEIQQSGLSSIRDKINNLLKQKYEVDVIKPLVTKKRLVKLDRKEGKVIDSRWSPKRGTVLDLFDELVHFTRVFPHKNLKLIVPLVQIEEIRYPGHGKRRRWRRNDFQIADRQLLEVDSIHEFKTAKDLQRLLPKGLPRKFGTQDLAERLDISRSFAQQIAYVLKHTRSTKAIGKQGNAILYKKV